MSLIASNTKKNHIDITGLVANGFSGPSIDMRYYIDMSVELVWTAGAIGEFTLEASNDPDPTTAWNTVDDSPTPILVGDSSALIVHDEVVAPYIRVHWEEGAAPLNDLNVSFHVKGGSS